MACFEQIGEAFPLMMIDDTTLRLTLRSETQGLLQTFKKDAPLGGIKKTGPFGIHIDGCKGLTGFISEGNDSKGAQPHRCPGGSPC